MYRVLIGIGLVFVSFSACTTPYKKPIIWTESLATQTDDRSARQAPEYEGILKEIDNMRSPENAIAGPDQEFRILVTHGMCKTSEDWANAWVSRINYYLDDYQQLPTRTEAVHIRDNDEYFVHTTNWTAPGSPNISLVAINWSDYANPARNKLAYDNNPIGGPDGTIKLKRPFAQSFAKKKVLNACVGDVLYALGENGGPLRDFMKARTCSFLGGSLSDNSGTCLIDEETAVLEPNIKRVIIGESLGTQLIFDAMQDIQGTSPDAKRLGSATDNILSVHYLANPVPLLNLARSMGLETIEKDSKRLSISDAKLVAFHDPADIFSYVMTKDEAEELAPGFASLTNVILSNGPTYFGLFAEPFQAHTTYADASCVMDIIFYGTENLERDAKCKKRK